MIWQAKIKMLPPDRQPVQSVDAGTLAQLRAAAAVPPAGTVAGERLDAAV